MRWPATLLVPTVSSDRVHCSFTQQAAQLIDFPQRAEDVGCLGTSRPASPRLWSAQPAVILRLFWPGRAVAAGLRSGQLGGFHLTHFNLRRPLPPTCGCCAATLRPGRRTPAGGRPPSLRVADGNPEVRFEGRYARASAFARSLGHWSLELLCFFSNAWALPFHI